MKLNHFTTNFLLNLIFFIAIQAKGEAMVCFVNGNEFESVKKKLPAVFQTLPVMFTVDSFFATAGVRLYATPEGKLKLESHVLGREVYSQETYIEKICYDHMEFKVTFENQQTYEIKTDPDNPAEVSISSLTFIKSSVSAFIGISERIKREHKQESENTRKDSTAAKR